MLVGTMGALAHDNGDFLEGAPSNKSDRKRFADGFRCKLGVDILEPCERLATKSNKNIANDDARFVRRTIGFHFEDDGGSLLLALQRLTERFGQPHGLEANTEITMGNAAFLQQHVHDPVYGRRGNSDGAKAREAGSGHPDGVAMGIDYGATHGRGLQANVEADVWCQGSAGPRAPLGGHETDGAESGHWTASARAADYQCETTWLDRGDVSRFCNRRNGFWTL
jgi:hypothetical protein